MEIIMFLLHQSHETSETLRRWLKSLFYYYPAQQQRQQTWTSSNGITNNGVVNVLCSDTVETMGIIIEPAISASSNYQQQLLWLIGKVRKLNFPLIADP